MTSGADRRGYSLHCDSSAAAAVFIVLLMGFAFDVQFYFRYDSGLHLVQHNSPFPDSEFEPVSVDNYER